MCSITVEVIPELQQLVFEIDSCPEQRAIQILPSNRSNQPLHERMRQRNIWHCLDFCYVQDSQIGFPLLKPIQRIVVGTEVLWHRPVSSNGLIEHPAERDTIDHSGMDAEGDDPAGILIHDNQDPLSPQSG